MSLRIALRSGEGEGGGAGGGGRGEDARLHARADTPSIFTHASTMFAPVHAMIRRGGQQSRYLSRGTFPRNERAFAIPRGITSRS